MRGRRLSSRAPAPAPTSRRWGCSPTSSSCCTTCPTETALHNSEFGIRNLEFVLPFQLPTSNFHIPNSMNPALVVAAVLQLSSVIDGPPPPAAPDVIARDAATGKVTVRA